MREEIPAFWTVDLFFVAEVSSKCGDNQVPISTQPSFRLQTDGSVLFSVQTRPFFLARLTKRTSQCGFPTVVLMRAPFVGDGTRATVCGCGAGVVCCACVARVQ